MKKAIFAALCILALCISACLTVTPKMVNAQASGGTHIDYETTTNVPTIDGKWTSTSEWTDGHRENIGSNAIFYDEWVLVSSTPTVSDNIIIETMDNTNDTGDYYQICLDGQNNLGSAPQTDDFLVNITGHATCTWYQGTGSGWTAISTPPSTTFQWQETLGTSPVYTASHYMLELMFMKTDSVNGQALLGIQFNMRIAVYDAHTGGYGLAAFPSSSTANNPAGWEYIDYSSSTNGSPDPLPIPESLNIGLIMVLSVVAVAVGSAAFKKRARVESFSKGIQ